MKGKVLVIEMISALFILLFVYASVSKLTDIDQFRIQIGQSPLLTDIAWLAAWAVPISEMIIALMLAVPRYRLVALYASFGIMVMFTAYIVAILNFSDHVPCSCGGVLAQMGWTEHLLFNIAFIILALAGIILLLKRRNAEMSFSNK